MWSYSMLCETRSRCRGPSQHVKFGSTAQKCFIVNVRRNTTPGHSPPHTPPLAAILSLLLEGWLWGLIVTVLFEQTEPNDEYHNEQDNNHRERNCDAQPLGCRAGDGRTQRCQLSRSAHRRRRCRQRCWHHFWHHHFWRYFWWCGWLLLGLRG